MRLFQGFFVFLIVLFTACQTDVLPSDKSASKKTRLPGVSGQIGELIVVMPTDDWRGEIGSAVIEAFEQPYPVTPQWEPRLNVIHKTWELYKKYSFSHRNVLIVNVEQVVDNREAKTIVHQKVNAKNQLIFEIIARTPAEFKEELEKNAIGIIQKIEDREIEREYSNVAKSRNGQAEKTLKEDHGIEMVIPTNFRISENENNFVWIRGPGYDGKKAATQEGILIYYSEYTSDSLFDRDILLSRRDTLLKAKVPGPQLGSYMTTQYHPDYTPQDRVINLNNRYTFEFKGIWRIKEGNLMAGPFVSITTVDEATNRLVTVEGYVYAPGEKKKALIRRMEAIIKTLNFSSESLSDPEELSK